MAEVAVNAQPRRVRHTARAVALELAVVTSVFMLYRIGRGATRGATGEALRNAHRVISWERGLGIFTERDVQRWVIGNHDVVEFFNHYYVMVHFPLTVTFLVWAYVWHVEAYRRLRTWFVIVTLSALVIHVMFPLAPPRMTGGFVDTLRVFGPRIYPADTSQSLANQFAAMPSLHFGWALMVAVGAVAILRSRTSLLVFIHPIVTLTAIVATGNHYWFDSIIAGILVVIAGSILLFVWRRGESVDTDVVTGESSTVHRPASSRVPCARRDPPARVRVESRTEPARPCTRSPHRSDRSDRSG